MFVNRCEAIIIWCGFGKEVERDFGFRIWLELVDNTRPTNFVKLDLKQSTFVGVMAHLSRVRIYELLKCGMMEFMSTVEMRCCWDVGEVEEEAMRVRVYLMEYCLSIWYLVLGGGMALMMMSRWD